MNPKRKRSECIGYRPDPEFVPFRAEKIEQTIPDRFRKQVEKYPDRLAVKTADLALTYAALNRAANRVAHAILGTVGSGQRRVAVLVEQSADVIVAILAVLKSGNVYVPLDPTAPPDRLRFVVEDSRSSVVVTNTRNWARAEQLSATVNPCLNMDEIGSTLSHADPGLWISPDGLATLLYTSGSTGEPKGVMHDHRIWLEYLRNRTQTANLSPNERMTLLGYPGFSGSFTDITDALLNGAAIVIYDVREEGVFGLAPFLMDECITVYHSVSTVYRQLTTRLTATEKFPALRQIMLSGEPITSQDLEAFKRHFSTDCTFCTRMGTTETTALFTGFVDEATQTGAGHLLGYPFESPHVSLLAEDGRELSWGEIGHIVVVSAYLSYGYWQRPALTAEVFQPSLKESGGRVYLTGDLGQKSRDGLFQHMGRRDFQVKIRGQRVEIGEIEEILLQQSGVNEAVVVPRKDRSGDPLLVAYVVHGDRDLPSDSFLRAKLAKKLPQYMIPQVFIWLDSLPVTANGKVDRKALPDPDQKRPELQEDYVAPRTPIEEELAEIWQKVLAQEPVGIDDNFFELGGHSLLATQVISRVNVAFDVIVPLRHLFEAPTIAGLAKRVATALSGEKLAEAPPLEPVTRDGDLPLSFAQQRLWFLNQLAPESWGYHLSLYLRSKGPLEVSVLDACLKEIVGRHETLRTTFAARDGVPVQVISPQSVSLLSQVDLRMLKEESREALVEKLCVNELHRPFELSLGPLLRVMLVRVEEAEYVWFLTMHHIVSDGWSMGVFLRELTVLYEAFSQGIASPLPDLPIQYADFSVWQREWLEGGVREQQLSYWKAELEGAPAVLGLPTDRQRPALQTFEGGRQTAVVPQGLHRSLGKFCKQHQVSLFMTLLAAFEVLLYRYTGQQDFVVGSPIANRTRFEIEALIGFFVNMMCLRADVSGDPGFTELLARVRERGLQAYANQDIPFEQLVEELGVERHLSHTPVFQVVFALQNTPWSALELPGVTLTPLRLNRVPVHYDLQFHLWEGPEGLAANMIYNTDLFDAGTIERMLGHYRALLEGVISNPDEQVSRLPLLTESERRQLLVDWNDTARPFPADFCIHELVEQQAEQTPDALALVFEEKQLTYEELNGRANQLGHYLRKLGVTPDERVGIFMERSLEMIVGLLAVLKAGGAYVPLHPSDPVQRLSFMIQDCGMSVVLTQATLRRRFSRQHSSLESPPLTRDCQYLARTPTPVCVDGDWRLIARENKHNPWSIGSSGNLAYVLYTSGSSGHPKAVMVEHDQVLNYVRGIQDRVGENPGASYAMVQPLTVDSCVTVVFPSLFSGGRLHLITRECSLDPFQLAEYFSRHSIDCLKIAPSHFRALQAARDPKGFLPGQWLVIGGEASFQDWIWELQTLAPSLRVFNHYGPTETTVGTLMQKIQRPSGGTKSITPLGYPLANTTRYVLDRHLGPAGLKIPGQLYLGGRCLTRGYLRRPDLTAAGFLPNPFTRGLGQRMYHTGDLTRVLEDGAVAFIGRTDQQAKIRGLRIELGEIEAALGKHSSVRECAVSAAADSPNSEKRLLAYVVAVGKVSAEELRDHLSEEVPSYMVPSRWVFLESLPRTPHGKLDLRGLPAPDRDSQDRGRGFLAPRTRTEELLARIWREVLGLERVGIHDNFFELGGHSLLATQVISRIRNSFATDIPLRVLFERPTIAGLAEQVDTIHWTTETSGAGHLSSDDNMEEETF